MLDDCCIDLQFSLYGGSCSLHHLSYEGKRVPCYETVATCSVCSIKC